MNRPRTGLERKFEQWALRQILAGGADHPLANLVDFTLRNWRARRHGHEHAPAVQIGHLVSFHSGAPERLALEDADQNQFKNWTIENRWRQGIAITTAVLIGGVPVEKATAQRWERLGVLKPGTTAKARPIPAGHEPASGGNAKRAPPSSAASNRSGCPGPGRPHPRAVLG